MAIKRPASASRSTPPAKAAKVTPEIKKVVKSLKGHPTMPTSTRSMLCGALPPALATYANERHEFQTSIVGMASTAMGEIDQDKQAAVARAQTEVDKVDKQKLLQVIPQQAQARAQQKCIMANKEADVVSAKLQCSIAQEAEREAKKATKAEDTQYNQAANKKTRFDELRVRVGEARTQEVRPKVAGALQHDLQSQGVDTSLLKTAVSVFTKPVAERGDFDALTLNNLDAELDTKGAEIAAALAALEPAKKARASTYGSVLSAAESAKAALDAANAAFKAAQSDVSVGQKSFTAAEKSLSNFNSTLKSKQGALQRASSDLESFRNGALSTFQRLSTRTRPVPAQEPEPAIARSPAPAAPATAQSPAVTKSPAV